MDNELISRIAELLEQVSDENEFLYRKSTGEIIDRNPEFIDERTSEDIEVNEQDYILLPTQYDIHEYQIMKPRRSIRSEYHFTAAIPTDFHKTILIIIEKNLIAKRHNVKQAVKTFRISPAHIFFRNCMPALLMAIGDAFNALLN